MHVLGIDVGTGGTRAVIIDDVGRVIVSATASSNIVWAEPQDTFTILRETKVPVKSIRLGGGRADAVIWARDRVAPIAGNVATTAKNYSSYRRIHPALKSVINRYSKHLFREME
jgi:N-acetylglucosamine kinase-like BadF-type ATPase